MIILSMKKFWGFIFLVLISNFSFASEGQKYAFNFYAKEYKEIQSLFSTCDNLLDPLRSIPLKQTPPVYPKRALELGIAGNTLLKIQVNPDGSVKDTEVVWSSSDDPKFNSSFNRSSIRAGNDFIYRPKVNDSNEQVAFTTYTTIAFFIQDQEYTLNLGNQTRNYKKLRRLMKKDPTRFLKEVETLLNGNGLEPIQKAIYLYFKGLTLYQQGEKIEAVIKILEESQKIYFQVYAYETDNKKEKKIYLMGSNEAKLHTYVGTLLGQLYLERSLWNEAAIQFSSVLRNVRNNKKGQSGRFLQSYVSLGIATFNLKLWCDADESWNNAISLAQKLNKDFPSWLMKFKEEAEKKRKL